MKASLFTFCSGRNGIEPKVCGRETQNDRNGSENEVCGKNAKEKHKTDATAANAFVFVCCRLYKKERIQYDSDNSNSETLNYSVFRIGNFFV